MPVFPLLFSKQQIHHITTSLEEPVPSQEGRSVPKIDVELILLPHYFKINIKFFTKVKLRLSHASVCGHLTLVSNKLTHLTNYQNINKLF